MHAGSQIGYTSDKKQTASRPERGQTAKGKNTKDSVRSAILLAAIGPEHERRGRVAGRDLISRVAAVIDLPHRPCIALVLLVAGICLRTASMVCDSMRS